MKNLIMKAKFKIITSAILITLCTIFIIPTPASAQANADEAAVNGAAKLANMVAASNSSSADKALAKYVCDSKDDQKEISSAIKAANGGEVRIAAGTYSISSSISVSYTGTTLSGAGSATILNAASTNGIFFIPEKNSNVTIQNLVIVGNSTGTANGIDFKGPATTLINIESKNWAQYAIRSSSASTGSQIIGCTTYNSFGGIALQNHTNDVLVQNCVSYNNQMHGITIGGGSNITIDSSTCYGNKYNGINVSGGSTYNTISNNHSYSNGKTGTKWGFNGICIIGAGNNYNTVINNLCEDNGSVKWEGHGISIDGNAVTQIITGNIVQGNICRNNHGKGIEIQFVTSMEIKDNVCFNNDLAHTSKNAGIDLTRSVTNSEISGNLCYDDQAAPTQKFGILERNTTTNGYNVITNNTAYGNLEGQIKIYSKTSTITDNTVNEIKAARAGV
jgi:hypothetical protein